MAAPLSFKVTFQGDTRKITSSPEELLTAIASRFSLERPDLIQLRFDNEDVDIEWIAALATVNNNSGRALKVDVYLNTPAPDYEPAPEFTPDQPPMAVNHTSQQSSPPSDWPSQGDWKVWKANWSPNGDRGGWKQCKQAHREEFKAQKNQEHGDWKAWKKNAKQAWKQDAKQAWMQQDWGWKNTNEDCDDIDPAVLKQKAKETKAAAKDMAIQAKAEAKAAKAAEKAYVCAEKAAHKAAVQAEKAARKAEKQANQQTHEVYTGKLVNWMLDDAIAAFGDLTILPCGRICFRCESHVGNLRVNKNFDVQKCGGKGDWAQFEAIPVDKPGVFRLSSHAFPDQFLGVAPSNEASLKSYTSGYAFVTVPGDSDAGLWSFFPEGQTSPFGFKEATADPEPRDVYRSMQAAVEDIAQQSKIPISIGEAPEDEAELIKMLNSLHDILPHGLKRIAMKKLGLRQFELPAEATPKEWESVLKELVEMGFDNPDDNLVAVKVADGDLKQAVRHLVKAMHAK